MQYGATVGCATWAASRGVVLHGHSRPGVRTTWTACECPYELERRSGPARGHSRSVTDHCLHPVDPCVGQLQAVRSVLTYPPAVRRHRTTHPLDIGQDQCAERFPVVRDEPVTGFLPE